MWKHKNPEAARVVSSRPTPTDPKQIRAADTSRDGNERKCHTMDSVVLETDDRWEWTHEKNSGRVRMDGHFFWPREQETQLESAKQCVSLWKWKGMRRPIGSRLDAGSQSLPDSWLLAKLSAPWTAAPGPTLPSVTEVALVRAVNFFLEGECFKAAGPQFE